MTAPVYDPGRSTFSNASTPRPSVYHSYLPNLLVMEVEGASIDDCRWLAEAAAENAKHNIPKLTGRSSALLRPAYWDGYFGIAWEGDHIWFQNEGIRAFTMNRLAGKVVPMWIDDPSGKERKKNPKAKTRTTAGGRVQVLLFRRAANKGERKTVKRTVGGVTRMVDVPRSYPGAPGRIALREQRRPLTTPGKLGGQIAQKNVGVRWRHPGLAGRHFLQYGLRSAADALGVPHGEIRQLRSND